MGGRGDTEELPGAGGAPVEPGLATPGAPRTTGVGRAGEAARLSDEPDDPAERLVGRVLAGRYRATRVLGRGGIGVVLEGMHLELHKKVAIKVLQAGYARDAEALERFEREARTAATIGHPNIVAVLDLGRLETGEPFFVMEHLIGRDLEEEVTASGPRAVPPVARSLEVLEKVAGALDALHREGIVHRDVKPANVFLATSARGEEVKLVDFGLATLADAERRGTRLTREGYVVGTAEYLAPECAKGALGGPRADVYSLATMAYELLTGALPFYGAPMEVLMAKIATDAPPISSMTSVRYAPELDDVFARALDRDPDTRPASCGALVAELRDALARPPRPEADPTRARTDELPRVRERRRARGRVLGASAALVALAVIVLGGAVVYRLGAAGAGREAAGGASGPAEAPISAAASEVAPAAAALAAAPTVPRPDELELPPAPAPAEPEPRVAAASVPTPAPPERGAGRRRAGPTDDRRPEEAPAGGEAAEAGATAAAPRAGSTREASAPAPSSEAHASGTRVVEPSPELVPEVRASAADLVREAQAALLHGEAARARDLFRDATRVGPRHAPAWRGLGIASEQLHESAEARRAFERYLELAPDAADAASIQARIERLGG